MNAPLVLANPVAGGGRARDRFAEAAEALSESLGRHDIVWTEAEGHAERVARAEAGSRPLLVAFGGDGTASEVARGIAASDGNPDFGILPCGTGNDFARDVGIPPRARDAAALLSRTEARETDLGFLELDGPNGAAPRHFLNSASVGFAASVARRAAAGRNLGRATYVVAAARELVGRASGTYRLALEDDPERPRILLHASFHNTRRFGGGVALAPGADVSDGALDAVLIQPLGPVRLAHAVARLALGTHYALPQIEHRTVRRAVVRPGPNADGPLLVEADGDLLTATRVTIGVNPGRLRVRRPEEPAP